MTDTARITFMHDFGYGDRPAYRFTNPDGSVGGVVADTATIGPRAAIGYGAAIGDGAAIGYDAAIGDRDWWLTIGPQGSRGAMLTAVQSSAGLRWWVGCQYGISTETLRDRVVKDHRGTRHETDYMAVINFVENHPSRLAWVANASK